jgi:hypothetical protein
MHAEPTCCSHAIRAIETRRTVMMVLLSGEHDAWSSDELQREIAGVRGNRGAVVDAIDELYGAGLVNVTGELLTPTRAARAMDELTLGAL